MAQSPLTDDFVADVLRRDAERKNSNRLLASGLGSLLSRPRSSAPKPNTRFLKNIVRDVDTHNATLKKKEEEESRARLRDLRRSQKNGKRRERSRSRERKHKIDKEDRPKRRRSSKDRSRHHEHHKKRSQSRSRSPRREHRHSKRQDCSTRRSPDTHRTDRKPRKENESRQEYDNQSHTANSNHDSDSDPLESIIGPKPPPKIQTRGRGAYKDSSMDTRFDANYDPKVDVNIEPDEDGDDWDMALEALRDRAKWRKSGADRLKAAGFTDDEVAKWDTAKGKEKDIEDVRWSKKGEGREWDRGKVVDGERVAVKPEWGRLKDT